MAVMGSPLVRSSPTTPSFLLALTGSWSSGTCSTVVGKGLLTSQREGRPCLLEAQGGRGMRRESVARGP